MPKEVTNLLYAVKIKGLAARAGIESVTTEEDRIIIRRFHNMPLDRQKLEPLLRDSVAVGRLRVTLDYKRLGREWRRVMEEVLRRI